MKPAVFVLALLSGTALLPWGSVTAQSPVTTSLILSPSEASVLPAEPFPIAITWEAEGILTVSPSLALVGGELPFDRMQLPPVIRATSENGWLVGEFALENGDWSPLFSAPNISISGMLDPASSGPATGFPSVQIPSFPSSSVPPIAPAISPLALGEDDPSFPSAVTPEKLQKLLDRSLPVGARRYFVNNVSGDDANEGHMLHPQKGNLKIKGPKRTLSNIIPGIKDGDEIVLVGAGSAYKWQVPTANITLTPIGNVILEP